MRRIVLAAHSPVSAQLSPSADLAAHGTPPAGVKAMLVRYLWALPNTILGLLVLPLVVVTRGNVRVVDGVLELHGWLLSCVLRHCVPLPGGAAAVTLGHVVLARDADALCATRQHERVHVRQCELWGPAFLPAYLVAAVWGLVTGRGAYAGNYFEREAFRQELCGRDI